MSRPEDAEGTYAGSLVNAIVDYRWVEFHRFYPKTANMDGPVPPGLVYQKTESEIRGIGLSLSLWVLVSVTN